MPIKAVQKSHNCCPIKKMKVGDVIYVRYYDAVLFKDALSVFYKPVIRETIGWLDYDDAEYIRLAWERYAEPVFNEETKIKTTGLALRKSDIIEVRKVA